MYLSAMPCPSIYKLAAVLIKWAKKHLLTQWVFSNLQLIFWILTVFTVVKFTQKNKINKTLFILGSIKVRCLIMAVEKNLINSEQNELKLAKMVRALSNVLNG